MKNDYDFSGWATKNDIQCSDGRTIRKDAFIENDGKKVPLVWNHQHNDPSEVLGHALLENRSEGVYAYCKFNDTEAGQNAKSLVVNGDIDQLSIYANKLKTQMNNVIHGCIREVSLVLAGANPGAFIDSVIAHSDENGITDEEGIIYTDENISVNSEESAEETETEEEIVEEPETEEESEIEEDSETEEESAEETETEEKSEEESEIEEKSEEESETENVENIQHSDEKEKTVESVINSLEKNNRDFIKSLIEEVNENGEINTDIDKVKEVIDTLNDEEQDAVFAAFGLALDNYENNKENKKEEGEKDMENIKHNVFEKDAKDETLMHSEIIADAIKDAKKCGSMKEAFIEHAAANNIENVDYLFPEATELYNPPKMIEEDQTWVGKVMNGIKHSPFSRVKTTFGQMNEEQAKAKGYIKGNEKANLKLALLRRVTTPTTVYLKNTMDRDDVIDITSFDVLAWIKAQMRKELDKDLATAILIGDGRDVSDNDKINETNIRPILTDDDFYSIKYTVTDKRDYDSDKENDSVAKGIIRAAIKSRKQYKGSGSPSFYTSESTLSDLLLIEDGMGRVIYESVEKLATALRVKEIVTVPEFERESGLYGIIVNLTDYTAGADKGGKVGFFDDFDIDYNQQKYLIETRMSGALNTPYAAIVLKAASNSNNAQG